MLHVSELKNTSLKKAKSNKQVYKTLLEKCYTQIKQKNDNCATNTIFTLPPFSLGLPLYNMDHAVLYILRKLQQGGFYIRVLTQNKIYIDWDQTLMKQNRQRKVTFM